MTQRYNDDQLIGFINHTITDIERDEIEARLKQDDGLRAQLDQLTADHRRIQQHLQHRLGLQQPAAQANFAAIAAKLPSQKRRWPTLTQTAWVGLTAVFLSILLFYFTNNSPFPAVVDNPETAVGDAVASERNLLKNSTFDDTLANWELEQDGDLFNVERDTAVTATGDASIRLAATAIEDLSQATFVQTIPTNTFQPGDRLRLSGQLKTANVESWAGLFVRITDKEEQFLLREDMSIRPLTGTADWARYEAVFVVPPNTGAIDVGIALTGNGLLWLDDILLEKVGDDIMTNNIDLTQRHPTNTTFDNVTNGAPANWTFGASNANAYEVTVIEAGYDGPAATIRTRDIVHSGFGTLMQSIPADEYRGQRVRFTAKVKTEDVSNWAGLWLRMDGQAPNEMLAFDNMQNRPIRGTRDWATYEIILDVPESTSDINYGILMVGNGRLVIDNVTLEIVSNNTPLTGNEQILSEARNLGFEGITDGAGVPIQWYIVSTMPQNYQVTQDFTQNASGTQASALLQSTSEPTEARTSYATLMQNVTATDYQGQRVRITAQIRTEDITTGADLWLQADSMPLPTGLLDDKKSIQGSNEWQPYTIEADIPANSQHLSFGVVLHGNGRVWIDDVQLQIID